MKRIVDFRKRESPEIDALIGWIIGRDRAFVLAHPEYKLPLLKAWKISRSILKLKQGTPFAYITGNKEFYGLDFIVNKHTLIPRPDTEIMVDEAINIINYLLKRNNRPMLIDVGTGSGCIPIAILKSIGDAHLGAIAVDISNDAIRVAKKNAKKHKVNIDFVKSNLLAGIELKKIISPVVFTANLPYLTTEQFNSEPSIQKEPDSALVADDDNGLSLYGMLLKQINHIVQSGVKEIYLLAEIDPRQSANMRNLIQKILPQSSFEIKKDLAGHDRLVLVKI